jgi:hypothetical protein
MCFRRIAINKRNSIFRVGLKQYPMLYFMLKKEIMKFVKNIFVEKKSISDGLEFEGTKINNLINGKGRTIILKLIPDASSNVEEDFSQISTSHC